MGPNIQNNTTFTQGAKPVKNFTIFSSPSDLRDSESFVLNEPIGFEGSWSMVVTRDFHLELRSQNAWNFIFATLHAFMARCLATGANLLHVINCPISHFCMSNKRISPLVKRNCHTSCPVRVSVCPIHHSETSGVTATNSHLRSHGHQLHEVRPEAVEREVRRDVAVWLVPVSSDKIPASHSWGSRLGFRRRYQLL